MKNNDITGNYPAQMPIITVRTRFIGKQMAKPKILVIDDQPQVTELVKLSLDNTGNYEVEVENDALKALEKVRAFVPDLVFLDVMLPGLSGAEIANQILEDDALKDTRIVFLTSIVSRQEAEDKGGEIAGRRFLAKPVKLEELVACIDEELAEE